MELDDQELTELADFLKRRFPADAERAQIRQRAGVEGASWTEMVRSARLSGRLPAMLSAAVRERPDDDQLAEVAATFQGSSSLLPAAIAGGALLLLVGGAFAWYGTTDTHLDGGEPDLVTSAVAPAPAAVIAAPAATPAPVSDAGEIVPGDLKGAELLEEDLARAEALAIERAPSEPPAPTGAVVDGRCGGPEGTRVGYWYADEVMVGLAGQTITVAGGVNVRADYPRKDNGWNAQHELVCQLRKGDRLVLSESPVLVDGGKYWVPLYAGDLES